MSTPAKPVVLVTGSSTGIGRATSLLLARSGYRVFATVRTPEAESSLRRASSGTGLEVLQLDVIDEGAVSRVAREVLDRTGRIDALVNNAGYAQLGAVEDLDRDTIRRQFEVNVFAAMQMCREVLPTMRAQRGGRIVNVSSMAGRVSVPLMGAYCASKFALEAFSDALRVEAKPFGIRVVIVEPGAVVTEFSNTAVKGSRGILEGPSVYAPVYRSYLEDFSTPGGATAEQVAVAIAGALRARRPRSRCRVRLRESLAAGFTQVVPKGAMDWATTRFMGLRLLGQSSSPAGSASRP